MKQLTKEAKIHLGIKVDNYKVVEETESHACFLSTQDENFTMYIHEYNPHDLDSPYGGKYLRELYTFAKESDIKKVVEYLIRKIHIKPLNDSEYNNLAFYIKAGLNLAMRNPDYFIEGLCRVTSFTGEVWETKEAEVV